jgi:hypothetical protein
VVTRYGMGYPRSSRRGTRGCRPARLGGSDEPGSVVHHGKGLVCRCISSIRSPGGLQQFGDDDHSYDSANSRYDSRRRERVHSSPPWHTGTHEHDDDRGTAAHGRTGPPTVRATTTTRRPREPGRLERLRRHAEPDGHSVLRSPVHSRRDIEVLRDRAAAADEVNPGRVQHLRSESELDNRKRAWSRCHPGRAVEHVRPAALAASFTRARKTALTICHVWNGAPALTLK